MKFLPVLGKLVKPVVIEALKDALTDVSFENVIGKKKNDVVEVEVPDGIIKYKVLEISKLN